MKIPAAIMVALLVAPLVGTSRPPDLPFRVHMIDGGASETAAVADFNRDGRLDIVSGEYWYEAPGWTKHRFRELGYTNFYIDDFSDLAVDVDGDGYPDIASVSWFAKKVSWWKNPGRSERRVRSGGGAGEERNRAAPPGEGPRGSGPAGSNYWAEAVIHSGFNVEFAILADVDNDGRPNEIVAQENGTPQAWYEVRNGAWVAHPVSDRSYGHGIGAGDVNNDGRNDILTPRGWLEAPADPRAGSWAFHNDWETINVPPPAPQTPANPSAPGRVVELGFIHVTDINKDGRNDVVTAAGHNYGVFWFEHTEQGPWIRHPIDGAWSQGHASTLVDLNGDGRLDLVTGKRFMAHNGSDPGEREPLGVYWYEYLPAQSAPGRDSDPARSGGGVEWVRHIIDYGGRMGGGLQIPAVDVDGDGDLDLVCAGKSGLFLVENTSRSARLHGTRSSR